MLPEISTGARSVDCARNRRDNGGYSIRLVIYIDTLSVFASATASLFRIPVDKGMMSHFQYFADLSDTRLFSATCWVDTRDLAFVGGNAKTCGTSIVAYLHARNP